MAAHSYRFDQAVFYVRLALRLPLLHPFVRMIIDTLGAQINVQAGKYEDALAMADEGLAIIARRPRQGINRFALSLLNLRAVSLEHLGRTGEAAQCRQAVLDVWSGTADRDGAGAVEVAKSEHDRGEYGLAIERMTMAIERSASSVERASRRLHLAALHSEIGHFDTAIAQVEPELDKIPDPLRTVALIGLVEWYLEEDHLEPAERHCRDAAQHAQRLGIERYVTQSQVLRSQVIFAQKRQHEAILYLEQMIADRPHEWSLKAALGDKLLYMGHLDDAAGLFDEALALMAESGHRANLLRCIALLSAAETQFEKGNISAALEHNAKAMETPVHHPRLLARAHSQRALLAISASNEPAAAEAFEAATAVFRRYGDAAVFRAAKGAFLGRWNLLTGDPKAAETELFASLEFVRKRLDLPAVHYCIGEARRGAGAPHEDVTSAYTEAIGTGYEGLYAARAADRLKELDVVW